MSHRGLGVYHVHGYLEQDPDTLERCITDKGRDRLAQLRAAT
jgi:hypothetical protein